MAVEIANVVGAMGSVLANGTEIGGPAGGVVTRTGPGVYKLVLDQPLAAGEYTAALCVKGAAPVLYTLTDVSESEKTIAIFDSLFAPVDKDFTWTIFQLPST
jgi:hypothetical protein